MYVFNVYMLGIRMVISTSRPWKNMLAEVVGFKFWVCTGHVLLDFLSIENFETLIFLHLLVLVQL